MTPRTLLATLAIVFLAAPSWAVLGKSVDSIAADRARLGGEVRATAAAGFSVHEIAAEDGGVVREYVSPGGIVFGVAWRGPTPPDLVALLGDYYTELQAALRAPVRRRGPLSVRTDHLVVETGGHMRDLHGRAYLPDHLPATVKETAIR